MAILSRLRRWVEKLFGQWHESVEPPARLDEMVATFARMYPHATQADWIRFACVHGRECYRSGYMRGVEYAEREEDPQVSPEQLADMMDPTWRDRAHDWEWNPGLPLHWPSATTFVPRKTETEADDIADLLETLEQSGRART